MSIRASLRTLERRVALAMPAPACGCPGSFVHYAGEPIEPAVCPLCGKKRLVIVIEDDYEAPPAAAGGRAS